MPPSILAELKFKMEATELKYQEERKSEASAEIVADQVRSIL
jgi:hypothetical protein